MDWERVRSGGPGTTNPCRYLMPPPLPPPSPDPPPPAPPPPCPAPRLPRPPQGISELDKSKDARSRLEPLLRTFETARKAVADAAATRSNGPDPLSLFKKRVMAPLQAIGSKAALEPDIAGALLCIAAAVRFRWNNGGFGSSEHNEQVLSYCTDVFPNSTSCSSMTAQTVLRWVGAPGFDLVLEDDLDKAAPPKRGRAAQASVHRFQPPNRSQTQSNAPALGNEERQLDAAPSAGPNEGGRAVDGGYTFVPKEQPAAATISVLGVKMNQKVTKKAQAQGGSKKQAKQVGECPNTPINSRSDH